MSTRMGFILAVMVGIILLAGAAYACVEPVANEVGSYLKNGCPYPVNVAWCFGSGCEVPDSYGRPVTPGFFQKISNNPRARGDFKFCKAPARVRDGGCRS